MFPALRNSDRFLTIPLIAISVPSNQLLYSELDPTLRLDVMYPCTSYVSLNRSAVGQVKNLTVPNGEPVYTWQFHILMANPSDLIFVINAHCKSLSNSLFARFRHLRGDP